MFTGIIEEVGRLRSLGGGTIDIEASKVRSDAHIGDSICVNGICLTVTSFTPDHVTADVMPETVRLTSLSRLHPGAKVNLERAMQPAGRLGGHIVSGHVDGCGRVDAIVRDGIADRVTISLEADLLKYIARKGSVTVDGVSLTVVAADDRSFAVSLIPQTRTATTLGELRTGSLVNVEVDVLARYIERLLTAGSPQKEEKKSSLSLEWLQENGF